MGRVGLKGACFCCGAVRHGESRFTLVRAVHGGRVDGSSARYMLVERVTQKDDALKCPSVPGHVQESGQRGWRESKGAKVATWSLPKQLLAPIRHLR